MITDLVRDWMTPDPIAVSPNTPLPEAHQLMKERRIRRLPVVEGGRVVGIVTLGDLREASPSDATSLSIYEIHYLLSKLMIRDIMTPDPIIVAPTSTLYDAARLMLENKIGGLPVVDEGKLMGIITESDIFRVVMANFEG